MTRPPRRTPPRRDVAAERERRARTRHERSRKRSGPATGEAPAPHAAVATRERHEGALGVAIRWLVAVPGMIVAIPGAVAAAPAVAGQVLRGFALEVVAVVAGILRSVASLVPGGGRVLRAPRASAGARPVATPGSRRGAAPREQPRARTTAGVRVAAGRRRQLRARVRGAAVVVLLAAVVAAWIVVPASDAFRIRHLEVTGTSAVSDLDVRDRIDSLLAGETVFTVDDDELRRQVGRLPFVREVRVERHLPGGLQLHVTEYRPLALGLGDGDFWLVAQDGRILAKANREEWTGRIPTVELRDERIRPGDRVGGEPSLQLLAARAPDSPLAFEVVRADRFTISARLVDGVEVRFGRPVQLLLKVAALERALELAERTGDELRYVDVSVPGKPAVCPASDPRCSQRRTPVADAARDAAAAAPTTPEESGGDEATDADVVG